MTPCGKKAGGTYYLWPLKSEHMSIKGQELKEGYTEGVPCGYTTWKEQSMWICEDCAKREGLLW